MPDTLTTHPPAAASAIGGPGEIGARAPIARFATAGGRYRVSATVVVEPDARLAVGPDLAADMTTTVLGAGVIALGGLLVAAAIAAAAWRRSGKTT